MPWFNAVIKSELKIDILDHSRRNFILVLPVVSQAFKGKNLKICQMKVISVVYLKRVVNFPVVLVFIHIHNCTINFYSTQINDEH